MQKDKMIQLSSSKSLQTSLESVRLDYAGLNSKRKLNAREAKKIGINACIEKIGIEFCKKYESNACTSCGERDDKMFCSVGIDDKDYVAEKNPRRLVLSDSGFQYIASCNVDMKDGTIEFLECVTP